LILSSFTLNKIFFSDARQSIDESQSLNIVDYHWLPVHLRTEYKLHLLNDTFHYCSVYIKLHQWPCPDYHRIILSVVDYSI